MLLEAQTGTAFETGEYLGTYQRSMNEFFC